MIKPFADDESSSTIAGMSVENGTAAIVVSGSLTITRDREGLETAQRLKEFADAVLGSLQTDALPESVESDDRSTGTVDNPFM